VKNVHILGEIKYQNLPVLYAGSDLFVFPSNTDTFGMVILEAQACGLPAIVSNQGGPKEIIRDHATGLVIPTDLPDLWVETIRELIGKIKTDDKYIHYLKMEARQMTLSANWDSVLADIFGEVPAVKTRELSGSNIRVKASEITDRQATLTV
jgi:glycosyltransferase involved in cell wall biosynthesis